MACFPLPRKVSAIERVKEEQRQDKGMRESKKGFFSFFASKKNFFCCAFA
jgi:hypothetical protein